jgi:peptidoglycan/xylan/chitin deacetylase (PgdA/CDA1 family)
VSSPAVVLHGLAGPPGTELADWLERGPHRHATHGTLAGSLPRIVVDVSGAEDLLAAAGRELPAGAARPEAVAARLRRAGVELGWGEPQPAADGAAVLALCRARGRSSVDQLRADDSLLTGLQIGAWFEGSVRERLARRLVLSRLPVPGALGSGPLGLRLRADAAFWSGVRSAATASEWRRLTRSSYAALVYHRLAGERKPGQERVDVDPRRFDAHVRTLARLGFHHLSPDELLAFHLRAGDLPRRSYLITVDDGFRDSGAPLAAHGSLRPQLFVSTAEVGGRAHWLDGEPVLDWEELTRLERSGVALGAHARRHRPLTELAGTELGPELGGSLADLRERLARPIPVLAYPNGRHDAAVVAAAAESGFDAAFTTDKGRNGAGTDRYRLRRISVHASDGRLAVLWKALTGETPPRLLRRAP